MTPAGLAGRLTGGLRTRAALGIRPLTAPVIIFILIASILFSILVASGRTAFPIWMAAVNPVTLTIAWLVLKRVLPQFVRDWTEGAGFNIAFLAFFACTTITLWNR